MTEKTIKNESLYMFGTNKQSVLNKKWAIAALALGILCLALFIKGLYDFLPRLEPDELTMGPIMAGLVIFPLAPVIGLVLSIIALVKSARKPAVYGGKKIAVAALIINSVFIILMAASIIYMVYIFMTLDVFTGDM